jgi:predicted transcriptional regulator
MLKRTMNALGEAEMELLGLVWELGSATVGDVHERVLQSREVAYTTTMTILKKLADKGYLQIEKRGNAFVYSPQEAPETVQAGILGNIIDKVFGGSASALVQTLVKQETLSEDEHAKITAMLEAMKQDYLNDE